MLQNDTNVVEQGEIIVVKQQQEEKGNQMKRSRASFTQRQLEELELRFSLQR